MSELYLVTVSGVLSIVFLLAAIRGWYVAPKSAHILMFVAMILMGVNLGYLIKIGVRGVML